MPPGTSGLQEESVRYVLSRSAGSQDPQVHWEHTGEKEWSHESEVRALPHSTEGVDCEADDDEGCQGKRL